MGIEDKYERWDTHPHILLILAAQIIVVPVSYKP